MAVYKEDIGGHTYLKSDTIGKQSQTGTDTSNWFGPAVAALIVGGMVLISIVKGIGLLFS